MRLSLLLFTAIAVLSCSGCRDNRKEPGQLRIFCAAGMMPVIEALRQDFLARTGIELQVEASGSQVACRKISELNRNCDLVILADHMLVPALLSSYCTWRMDFATDAMVLGVGARAQMVETAEQNWPQAVLDPRTRIARADENQGPIGYRTIMVLQLHDRINSTNTCRQFMEKCSKMVDDASGLPPLLKAGEIDYAFLYRSLCAAHELRFIPLPESIDLSSATADYSSARVDITAPAEKRMVTVTGHQAVWTLSIPENAENPLAAKLFIRYLISDDPGRQEHLTSCGFSSIKPVRLYNVSKDGATEMSPADTEKYK